MMQRVEKSGKSDFRTNSSSEDSNIAVLVDRVSLLWTYKWRQSDNTEV